MGRWTLRGRCQRNPGQITIGNDQILLAVSRVDGTSESIFGCRSDYGRRRPKICARPRRSVRPPLALSILAPSASVTIRSTIDRGLIGCDVQPYPRRLSVGLRSASMVPRIRTDKGRAKLGDRAHIARMIKIVYIYICLTKYYSSHLMSNCRSLSHQLFWSAFIVFFISNKIYIKMIAVRLKTLKKNGVRVHPNLRVALTQGWLRSMYPRVFKGFSIDSR